MKKTLSKTFGVSPRSSVSPSSLDLAPDVKAALAASEPSPTTTEGSPRDGSSPRKVPTAFASIGTSPTTSPRTKEVNFNLFSTRSSPGRKSLGTSSSTQAPVAGAGTLTVHPSCNHHDTSQNNHALGTPPNTARTPKPMEGLWGLLGYALPVDSAIHDAARQGDMLLLQTLVAQDKGLAAAPGDNHITPLMLASDQGHLDAVRFLMVDAKADATAKDGAKRTALHHLALGGLDRPLLAACLVEQGKAEVDAVDQDGRTPLHLAALTGGVDVVRALLEYGANPLAMDLQGADPLQVLLTECDLSASRKKELARVLEDAQDRAKAKGESKSVAAAGGGVSSPGACLWTCAHKVSGLCSEGTADDGDDDEIEVAQRTYLSFFWGGGGYVLMYPRYGFNSIHHTHSFPSLSPSTKKQAIEHQLARVFRASAIAPEAAEVYMESLRRHGYDNILALRALAADRFKMSLRNYVPDQKDRKKLIKALDGEQPPSPPLHLPAAEYLKHVLSVADDTAGRYAEGLRGLQVHTGAQLVGGSYEEIESSLGPTLLQGHKKALKILLRTHATATTGRASP